MISLKRSQPSISRGLIVFCGACSSAFPLLWFFAQSIRSRVETMANAPSWHFTPTLDSFKFLLGLRSSDVSSVIVGGAYLPALAQSLQVALLATSFAVLLGVPAGYAMGRSGLKPRDVVSILGMFVLPPAAIALSLLPWAARLGLYDSTLGLAIVHSATAIPIVIFIVASQPYRELVSATEAAELDGLSASALAQTVVVPFLAPPVLAAGLMAFLTSYSEFFFSLVLTGSHVHTMPVVLAGFQTLREVQWGLVSAGSLMAVLPVLAIAALLAASRPLRSALRLGF